MTISYSAPGALAEDADTITPAYPSSPTADQLLVLTVLSGHTDDPTPATPSGWMLVSSTVGGGGTFGAGAGPRRLTWFVRVATGGDSTPTTSITSGSTGSLIAGRIHVLDRSAGTGWRWAVSTGEDTSSDTSLSAAAADALTWAAGDFALLAYAVHTSTASMTSEAIAATGITYGTVTEQADDSLSTGYAGRLAVASTTVSSGADTQAPTVSATLAAASTGVAGVLRIREASADVEGAQQTVFPPRTLVTATGLAADDIVTVTYYRQVGSTLTAVRAATDVDVTGQDALLRIDAEQPFGVPYEYLAVLTDVNGLTWNIYSSTFTDTVTTDVISDAVRGVGAHATIKDWPSKKRTRDASVFNINGRLVVVGKARSAPQATVMVSTETTADGDALQDVLDNATEGTILVRASTSLAGVDGHLALISDDERRAWYIPYREWDLEIAETEAWSDVLEASGFTLQDIADNFDTLQDIADAFPGTLLDIAIYDFGS
ncbi:hypothetical protein ACL02U_12140 [Streptomyces sp. MS06]|uniref:hypothetical protein n=1 Tax=Streptomyces sp. MS06 TaxID=3385974 RepID=UPI0039A187E3